MQDEIARGKDYYDEKDRDLYRRYLAAEISRQVTFVDSVRGRRVVYQISGLAEHEIWGIKEGILDSFMTTRLEKALDGLLNKWQEQGE